MLGYNCQYARANVKRKEVAKLEESYRNEKSSVVEIMVPFLSFFHFWLNLFNEANERIGYCNVWDVDSFSK